MGIFLAEKNARSSGHEINFFAKDKENISTCRCETRECQQVNPNPYRYKNKYPLHVRVQSKTIDIDVSATWHPVVCKHHGLTIHYMGLEQTHPACVNKVNIAIGIYILIMETRRLPVNQQIWDVCLMILKNAYGKSR